MQVGLAILMAYHFHRATTMGMPANLAVIPLTQLLMPAAAAAVALGYFSLTLAKPAVWISGLALQGNYRNRALARRRANGGRFDRRLASCHAIRRHDTCRTRRSRAGDAGRAREAHCGSRFTGTAGSRRIVDCIRSFASAHSTRHDGDDGHRRWPGRFHSSGHSSGSHHAHRCRRPAAMDALRLRHRRTGRLVVSLESWHRSSGYRRDHASSCRPPRRHAGRDREFPSARALDQH